jgi:anti-sigma regulatory factor (Ser/Thr protein kinase)
MAEKHEPITLKLDGDQTGFVFKIEPGLDEDFVWRSYVLPHLTGLAENSIDIWWYCVTEMVNNAIDHSDGTELTVVVERRASKTVISVLDDGIGIFRKIGEALGLPDERQAILELSKGKLTTDPDRHTGQGIFFTSRVLDEFQILSRGLFFTHQAGRERDYFLENARFHSRTMVDMALSNDTDRTLKTVFDQYSSGEDYDFTKTIVPLRLAKLGTEKLISRSQAKVALARIDRFKSVVFDFEGIEFIGQGFADEMFRVWANAHSDVGCMVIYANEEVRKMIAAVSPAPNVIY